MKWTCFHLFRACWYLSPSAGRPALPADPQHSNLQLPIWWQDATHDYRDLLGEAHFPTFLQPVGLQHHTQRHSVLCFNGVRWFRLFPVLISQTTSLVAFSCFLSKTGKYMEFLHKWHRPWDWLTQGRATTEPMIIVSATPVWSSIVQACHIAKLGYWDLFLSGWRTDPCRMEMLGFKRDFWG